MIDANEAGQFIGTMVAAFISFFTILGIFIGVSLAVTALLG